MSFFRVELNRDPPRAKSMKRVIALAVLASSLLLSGCDYRNDVEKTLMKQCSTINDMDCERDGYKSTSEALLACSDVEPKCTNDNDKPFARQLGVFAIDDAMFKKSYPDKMSISKIYNISTGRSIVNVETQPTVLTQSTVKTETGTVLSPALYDELINAVKTCNRASIEASKYSAYKQLSADEYEKVISIILDCKKFQLEQAINSKG